MFTSVITKVLGGQLLTRRQTFVAAFDTMFGGFRERAEQTYRLLQAPGTAFLVVAAPEPDALREASYFVERLAEERMPLAGLVVNRVHRSGAPRRCRPHAARPPRRRWTSAATHAADRRAAAAARRADAASPRGRRGCARASPRSHPTVPGPRSPPWREDVHDLEGLRYIARELAGELEEPAA